MNIFLSILSCLIVAFGQPAWDLAVVSIAASIFGYALFWRQIDCLSTSKQRFIFGTLWMGALQLIQSSWFLSHPYFYIVAVWLLIGIITGVQFGILCLFIKRPFISSSLALIFIPSLWTLFEWSRLFWLSGYSWNPAGLSLADNAYTLQLASLAGVYGMTFWVMLTNTASLQAYLLPSIKQFLLLAILVTLPFIYGFWQYQKHDQDILNALNAPQGKIKALLVQTAFPAEEAFDFSDPNALVIFVLDEWKKIAFLVAEHQGEKFDLIALPEFVVPFGAYSFVFPLHEAEKILKDAFGAKAAASLPLHNPALVHEFYYENVLYKSVNNAFFVQAISDLMDTDTVAGLEDVEVKEGQKHYYSAALYFHPESKFEDYPAARYSKQVLVPMAEYIPMASLRELAAVYGISGSFTPGDVPRVAAHPKSPYGVSICYEETFGDLMRQNRVEGADLLVNLTSDVWFPNSKLPRQHFEHARLRCVENGVPLLRACNTGITSAIDSLGRLAASFQGDFIEEHEWTAKALVAEVSGHTYQTLYTKTGDNLIVIISLIGVIFSALFFKLNRG